MYDALDKSVGYLTVSPGWCNGTNCKASFLQYTESFNKETEKL